MAVPTHDFSTRQKTRLRTPYAREIEMHNHPPDNESESTGGSHEGPRQMGWKSMVGGRIKNVEHLVLSILFMFALPASPLLVDLFFNGKPFSETWLIVLALSSPAIGAASRSMLQLVWGLLLGMFYIFLFGVEQSGGTNSGSVFYGDFGNPPQWILVGILPLHRQSVFILAPAAVLWVLHTWERIRRHCINGENFIDIDLMDRAK